MNSKIQTSHAKFLFVFMTIVCCSAPAVAQDSDLQKRVAEMKQTVATNKQELMQYTWQEQVNTILKGEQKKQEHFRVQLGPDGKPQKTSLDPPANTEPHGGPLKRHIVEKKKEEFKEYSDQIKELIQQYVPPEKDLLEQAVQRGNIMIGPAPGAEGQYRMVISNYIKKGDNMTLVIDKAEKSLASISVASYLDDPSNAVTVFVQFGKIPGGPNSVAAETINGVKKQLTIQIQNTNYQKK
ncbi:MAG TPA: hypothetical protein VN950_15690 [Terriglobales bacterium]|nr:hypothetical protein [Terriglobales bacterium]